MNEPWGVCRRRCGTWCLFLQGVPAVLGRVSRLGPTGTGLPGKFNLHRICSVPPCSQRLATAQYLPTWPNHYLEQGQPSKCVWQKSACQGSPRFYVPLEFWKIGLIKLFLETCKTRHEESQLYDLAFLLIWFKAIVVLTPLLMVRLALRYNFAHLTFSQVKYLKLRWNKINQVFCIFKAQGKFSE